MSRTLKVLLVIAIVISVLQVTALAVDLLAPDEASPFEGFAAVAGLRWMVYSIAAVAALLLGFVRRKRAKLAGDSLLIAGVYLLLLANNGGLFASGHEVARLVTSILTCAFLLVLASRDTQVQSGTETMR